MSSRVYRRLHGKNDLQAIHNDLMGEDVESEDDVKCPREPAVVKPKKNLYALALMDNEKEEDDSDEGDGMETFQDQSNQSTKSKKKKKRNKKKRKEEVDEDELLDQAIADQQSSAPHSSHSVNTSPAGFNPLTVQVRNLNPDIEMKKKFGSKVVGGETKKKNHRTYKKTSNLVIPKNSWQPIKKSGLEMSIRGQEGDNQIFIIEHKPEYQKVQHQFWDAVDSMSPDNLMAVLQIHPYHIDTLLQLSEVCRMSEDPQMAAELIERAIYAYESSLHPLFNVATGKCLLDYKVWENRGLFLAIFRHIYHIGNRGCYRTSLEFCKLLLGLDPDADPLCVLLMLDFYALRSDEYNYLVQLYQIWNSSRNLRVLPNFAFSIPLAMFHTSEPGTPQREHAEKMLQESLMMFPGLLIPLLDKCGVNTDADKNINKFFGVDFQYGQPASLKQLVNLYVGRCFSCWKIPECIAWLEENVQAACAIGLSDFSRFQEFTERGRNIYKGQAPLNVYRHLLLSEIKSATSDLPVEITSKAVLSYDPLPPPDTIRSYERRDTRQRQIENQGFFQALFNSLRPDFDVNALLAAEEADRQGGAGGGVRAGVGNLMNAVRQMLNNIELAPAPRDNEGDEDDNLQQDWD